MNLIDRINSKVEKHALAAQSSQYDSAVAITAVARARKVIANVFEGSNSKNPRVEILANLLELHSNYNDTDGEYTNGKGVLGNLIADIEIELYLTK